MLDRLDRGWGYLCETATGQKQDAGDSKLFGHQLLCLTKALKMMIGRRLR